MFLMFWNVTKRYFSFDKMLDMKGNTAAYLLYQLTRIRSVVRKVGDRVTSDDLQKVADALDYKFDHPNERKLAKAILKYHEILYQVNAIGGQCDIMSTFRHHVIF